MKKKKEHACFEGPTILYFGFWFFSHLWQLMGTHWDWVSATESLNWTVYGPWASQVSPCHRIHLPMQKTQETWVRKIRWSRKWLPAPVFLPGKFQGQRNRVGYSPWGRKKSDTTEWLSTHMVLWGKILRFSNMLRISALDLFFSWCVRWPMRRSMKLLTIETQKAPSDG